MQVSKSHDLVTLTANNYYQENDKMFRMADMRMAGPGGQESVRVLGCSENMTGHARILVIRALQEHLTLEATKILRPGELPGVDPSGFPLETPYRLKCILGGLSEGNTAIWQKDKISIIVGTASWVCPEALKSRGKWILVKTSIYRYTHTIYDIQVYISEKIDPALLWRTKLMASNQILWTM